MYHSLLCVNDSIMEVIYRVYDVLQSITGFTLGWWDGPTLSPISKRNRIDGYSSPPTTLSCAMRLCWRQFNKYARASHDSEKHFQSFTLPVLVVACKWGSPSQLPSGLTITKILNLTLSLDSTPHFTKTPDIRFNLCISHVTHV